MKKLLMLLISLACSYAALAQDHSFITLMDAKTRMPLSGATVNIQNVQKSYTSDSAGRVFFADLAPGQYQMTIRFPGYVQVQQNLALPVSDPLPQTILLKAAAAEELEEVVVTSTRSSRTIANLPTRIEVIAGEELDEKANMKPGDIRMVLNESTGIQTQQTSATSANASIRIQGLDGRYTQILKDGFPLYSGAASGLGLLQTPPLDLKQVEVIKGSSSTLYGGGAIAGLVNLISKTPGDEPELHVHLNGTSAGGLDLNAFYAERYGKSGITLFASRNSNSAYAPEGIDFTAIPQFTRYTLNPKLFLYFNNKTTANFGVNSSFEKRSGGDLLFLEGNGDAEHRFFEGNRSTRLSTQFSLQHQLDEQTVLNIRNSLSYFNREITVPDYLFDGTQKGTFSEVSLSHQQAQTEWVAGLNLWTDQFKENQVTLVPLRNYSQTTVGAFIQNNTHATTWLEIEAGLRSDYIVDYGIAILPRLSALFKISEKFNSRIGGGLGYKTPTIFTEESERIQYQGVLPISAGKNKLERSFGLNWDVNYRTLLFNEQVSLSINHLIFYTFLNHPLTMVEESTDLYRFDNLSGHMDSKGMETNVKLSYQDFKLFVGYSLTDAKIHSDGELRQQPLTAKHRLNNVLMYEVEDRWKLGAEAYYYSKQQLSDGAQGKSYWIFGFMAEKLFERFSLYINFENFSDTRQTRFDTINTGTIANPVFRDIYAPLDGFVVNGGLKIKL